MSPSVAECMRAIFAAFLWHEGIVHDAMACASFLKFHPDLTKQAAFQCRPDIRERPEVKLTKEQKARQRHSVEVSACNYLNVIPQNTEDFFRPKSNVTNMNEVSRAAESETIIQKKDEEMMASWIGYQSNNTHKLATVMEAAAGGSCTQGGVELPELPLVLRHVVLLWEELSVNCMNAVTQQMILPSPTIQVKPRKIDRLREKSDKEKKHKHKKKSALAINEDISEYDFQNPADIASHCDLCGKVLSPQHPQDHFFTNHPGCTAPSHGCGYVGGRWKFFPNRDHFDQPCGMVVRGCYHLCWSCRHKYKAESSFKSGRSDLSVSGSSRKSKRKATAAANRLLSPTNQLETHLIMRNNAMFLLDLASAAAGPALPLRSHRRSLHTGVPDVTSPDNSPFPQVC